MTVQRVLDAAEVWLNNYGEVEPDGYDPGCTQLDHGYQEYHERVDLIVALRELLAESGR